MEFFPTIVSKARTLEVISCGMMGSRSSTLQLVKNIVLTSFFYLNYIHIVVEAEISPDSCRCMQNSKCFRH